MKTEQVYLGYIVIKPNVNTSVFLSVWSYIITTYIKCSYIYEAQISTWERFSNAFLKQPLTQIKL